MSLRVDLEVASQDLRVGVRVKVSTLEKALLPAGTVRLLGFYFRGSVSIRAELRDEFPFVSTVRSGSTPRDTFVVTRLPPTGVAAQLFNLRLKVIDAPLRSSLESSTTRAMVIGTPLGRRWGSLRSEVRAPCAGGTINTRFPPVAAAATAAVPCEQAFVAFDYTPDVQVKLDLRSLEALTLGAVPAAVDEWARIALLQALAPYVLPG